MRFRGRLQVSLLRGRAIQQAVECLAVLPRQGFGTKREYTVNSIYVFECPSPPSNPLGVLAGGETRVAAV